MVRAAFVWLLCACATGAAAQTPAAPSSTAPAPEVTSAPVAPAPRRTPKPPPQTLQLSMSLFAGGADDMSGAAVGTSPTAGAHADADATLIYERRAGRATLAANARSVVRHDARAGLTPMWQQGGVEVSFAGARQRFRASQGVSYSPYYEFGGIHEPGVSPLGDAAQSHGDFANRDLAAVTSATAVEWSRPISRRFALSAAYNLRQTTFGRSEFDMRWQSAGARVSRRFTRYVSLRTGYTYRLADPAFAQTRSRRNHELDLGLDYSRPVSISRRTTISFGSGSSLTPQNQRMAFNITGDAALTRQIGRTWNARLGVSRSVQLLEGFTEPVLANALTAYVGGALRRRVTLSSTATFSDGAAGLDRTGGNRYASWTGGAGLNISLGRRAAMEAQYFYAGYRFDGNLALAPGLANGRQRRHGARVGFTWHHALLDH